MDDNDKKLARELLDLERKSAQLLLTPDEKVRWEDLARKLFKIEGKNPHLRRCFRIPAKGRCTVLYNGRFHDCDYHEVAWCNFTLSGELFNTTVVKELLTIDSLKRRTEMVRLQLQCKIVRLRTIDGSSGAGVEILDENPPEAIMAYVQKVFEPIFHSFLNDGGRART